MDKDLDVITERIAQMFELAYEAYWPLAVDACNRTMSEDEVEHLLDGLLSFACDDRILELFKRVCRRYLSLYPSCIVDYIGIYREMWEEEDGYSKYH